MKTIVKYETMAINGPIKMYEKRPIVRHDVPVELPTCMYKLKNVYGSRNGVVESADHVSTSDKKLDIFDQNNQQIPGMAELQARQEKILQQLAELKDQMMSIKSDLKITAVPANTCLRAPPEKIIDLPNIVIHAGPNFPPYSLALVQRLWQDRIHLSVTTHLHSTVPVLPKNAKDLSDTLKNFKPKSSNLPKLSVRLIWNNVGADLELLVSIVPILGEVNVLRYLSRCCSNILSYEQDPEVFEIDSLLDVSHSLISSKISSERSQLVTHFIKSLGKSDYLMGRNKISVADLAAVSAIKQVATKDISSGLSKWVQRCESIAV
ncbi:probable aminoacyl tRNA synthase complex-interacting multifunctional protein 2 isoform X2 [Aethina tumida]|uniref:probable aminoacyl tRNA synthase complex-interacting multifunctional protein 2 isoform X2 n=1 Tax=Aethina tumida TaxID=116153 RepID=UPI00096B3638|nr:probable aminoacyl tRNA synthase complex-interacting multifunctional protein 2 isoform X2 [Aethina tumida]